jgi:hypothetical protein
LPYITPTFRGTNVYKKEEAEATTEAEAEEEEEGYLFNRLINTYLYR